MPTPNLGLTKPTIGNTTTWGTELNTDLDLIDAFAGTVITSLADAVVKTPSADQAITLHNLNPNAANTTQSLGASSAPWNATLRNVTSSFQNGVWTMDNVKYPFTTAGLKAAIADAIAAGGGIVDARAVTLLDITSEIGVGNAAQVPVCLLLPHKATWTIRASSWALTDAALRIYSNSAILGSSSGGSNKMIITAENAAIAMDSILATDSAPAGGGSYVRVEGLQLYNPQPTPTFASGALHAQFTYDSSYFANIVCANYNGVSMYVHSCNYGTTFYNCEANGNGTGHEALLIAGDAGLGSSVRTNFVGGGFTHSGNAFNVIKITGGLFIAGVSFFGSYIEGNTGTSATNIVLVDSNTANCSFHGVRIGHSNTQYGWRVETGAMATFTDCACDSGNIINDIGNATTVTDANAPYSTVGFYTSARSNTKGTTWFAKNQNYSGTSRLSNGADSSGELDLDTGSTAAQATSFTVSDRGTNQWSWQKDSSNNFKIVDRVNNLNRASIALGTGAKTFDVWRVGGHMGTPLVAGDYAASGGWGASPTITAVRGTDAGAHITILADAGTGANPTITLTFKDGTWSQTPVIVACRMDNAVAPTTAYWAITAASATSVQFTFVGTPTSGNTYGLTFICIGT